MPLNITTNISKWGKQLKQGENILRKRINSSQQKFVLGEDIYSVVKGKNVLLFPKCERELNEKEMDLLLRHKLDKPIDSYLKPVDAIELTELVAEIDRIGSSVLAYQLPDFSHAMPMIDTLLSSMKLDSSLLGKISILRESDPKHFDHAILTSFMMTEFGLTNGFKHEELVDGFAAGLFHNIGKLYIEPHMLQLEKNTFESRIAIASHPVSSFHILKTSKCFSDEMLESVLNHHELLDGSGYPRNLKSNAINLHARLLNVVSSYCSMICKGLSAHEALRLLAIHARNEDYLGEKIEPMYDQRIVKALTTIVMKTLLLVTKHAKPQPQKQVTRLLRIRLDDLFRYLRGILKLSTEMLQETIPDINKPIYQFINYNVTNIYHLLNRSGLTMAAKNYMTLAEWEEIAYPDLQHVLPDILQRVNRMEARLIDVSVQHRSPKLSTINKTNNMLKDAVDEIRHYCNELDMFYQY